MKDNVSTLKNQYELQKSRYDKLCKEVPLQLAELLREGHITLAFPIDSRVKSWESISEKCTRNAITPAALDEIGDIAGIRIVLMFKRDQERVCDIIQHCFEVLAVEDTTSRLAPDQFGYGSIHFQVKLKTEWLALPTMSGLQDLQAEIQVRTAPQHIWAEGSRTFQYKRESHVPKPLRRAINRVAALLELVDLEFDRVLTERETYVGELGTLEEDQPLNTDVLEKVLADELPLKNRGLDEKFGNLLDDLVAFNINSAKSLRALLKKHHDAILAADTAAVAAIREKKEKSGYDYEPERVDKGVFFTYAGLTREALHQEFGRKRVESYLVEKYAQVKLTDDKKPR